jgi:hypothetical protein
MQTSAAVNVPFPDLRILPTHQLHPHEQHDSQRSVPLIARLQTAEYLSNPPIVTPIPTGEGEEAQYVVLDGANRSLSFEALSYPHILAQVVGYQEPYVSLDVWHHVISEMDVADLLSGIRQITDVEIIEDYDADLHDLQPLVQILTPDHRRYAITTQAEDAVERNRLLCDIVELYHRSAILNRTTIQEFDELLPLYPHASALLLFPPLHPQDILTAARDRAYLPPGISRHIVQGRAIQVNFPLLILRDDQVSLDDKNEMLKQWIQHKMSSRQVRYYAEATYQFDE